MVSKKRLKELNGVLSEEELNLLKDILKWREKTQGRNNHKDIFKWKDDELKQYLSFLIEHGEDIIKVSKENYDYKNSFLDISQKMSNYETHKEIIGEITWKGDWTHKYYTLNKIWDLAEISNESFKDYIDILSRLECTRMTTILSQNFTLKYTEKGEKINNAVSTLDDYIERLNDLSKKIKSKNLPENEEIDLLDIIGRGIGLERLFHTGEINLEGFETNIEGVCQLYELTKDKFSDSIMGLNRLDSETMSKYLNVMTTNMSVIDTLSKLYQLKNLESVSADIAAYKPEELEHYLQTFSAVNKVKNKLSKSIIKKALTERDSGELIIEKIIPAIERIYPHIDKISDKFKKGEECEFFEMFFMNAAVNLGKYAVHFFENIRDNFTKNKMINFLQGMDVNVANILDETDLTIDSNKKVNKFFDIVGLLNIAFYQLDVEKEGWENVNKSDFNSIESYCIDRIKSKVGNISKEDIMTFSPYMGYMIKQQDEDAFPDFLSAVLNDEMPEEYTTDLPSLVVPIKFEKKTDIEKLREEMKEYSNIFQDLTGKKMPIKAKKLEGYQRTASDMYKQLKEWKRNNAEEAKEKYVLIKEIEPNLQRILNMKELEISDGTMCFEPYNFRDQLTALKDVTSCLSPGGCNFHYTKHYLANVPDVFFATIKTDKGKIVGRTTIARGTEQDSGKSYVARVSAESYTLIPVSAKEMDRATKIYGEQINAETLKDGTMHIQKIGTMAYDDYLASTEHENMVIVGKTMVATA